MGEEAPLVVVAPGTWAVMILVDSADEEEVPFGLTSWFCSSVGDEDILCNTNSECKSGKL